MHKGIIPSVDGASFNSVQAVKALVLEITQMPQLTKPSLITYVVSEASA